MVSEVEHFIGSCVSAVLRMFPEKMGSKSFKLSEIISASSTDELIYRASSAVLYELMYEKPFDYIRKLGEILSIDTASLNANWLKFIELKARRDLGIHNNWIVNDIYLRKVKEADITTSYVLMDRVIPNFNYIDEATNNCVDLVEEIVELLSQKWLSMNLDEYLAKEG